MERNRHRPEQRSTELAKCRLKADWWVKLTSYWRLPKHKA